MSCMPLISTAPKAATGTPVNRFGRLEMYGSHLEGAALKRSCKSTRPSLLTAESASNSKGNGKQRRCQVGRRVFGARGFVSPRANSPACTITNGRLHRLSTCFEMSRVHQRQTTKQDSPRTMSVMGVTRLRAPSRPGCAAVTSARTRR